MSLIYFEIGQVEEVLEYFQGKKNGFFIEAGAWDGEYLSNTLYLEVITHNINNYLNNCWSMQVTANWTGLLVEPNIGAYTTLLSRNRKAHSIHSCLAVEKHPSKVEFDAADVFGGINKDLDKVDAENLKRVRFSDYSKNVETLFVFLHMLLNPIRPGRGGAQSARIHFILQLLSFVLSRKRVF